jgi:galactokinase
MTETHAHLIAAAFRRYFGEPAILVQGPGRVNLIGEHTDYNMGYVLPAAVDKAIWLALRPRNDGLCRFHSVDFDESFEMPIDTLARSSVHWANYLMGVLSELAKDGHKLKGVDCAFGGDIPIGSGMSSSAALECGFAFGLNELFALGYDRVQLSRLGRRAENRFVGVNCGIMDQFASLLGREGHLIRLDCRDLTFEYVPFERDDLRIVLCDTRVRRALAHSEYNVRRAQCETGVAILAKHFPEVKSLRDATLEMIEMHRSEFDPVVHKRCEYVVRENRRVVDGCAALRKGDFKAFGALMNEIHAGAQPGLRSLQHGAGFIGRRRPIDSRCVGKSHDGRRFRRMQYQSGRRSCADSLSREHGRSLSEKSKDRASDSCVPPHRRHGYRE